LLTTCLQELGLNGTYADGVTAAALNQSAFDAAIAAVNPKAAERYRTAGWQLAFGEDEPTPDVNAEKFIRQGAMKFTAVPAAGADGDGAAGDVKQQQKRQLGVVTVTSPVLTSKSISETVQQAGEGPQGEAMIAATKVRALGPRAVQLSRIFTLLHKRARLCWCSSSTQRDVLLHQLAHEHVSLLAVCSASALSCLLQQQTALTCVMSQTASS
jgi:hypothetical protein